MHIWHSGTILEIIRSPQRTWILVLEACSAENNPVKFKPAAECSGGSAAYAWSHA